MAVPQPGYCTCKKVPLPGITGVSLHLRVGSGNIGNKCWAGNKSAFSLSWARSLFTSSLGKRNDRRVSGTALPLFSTVQSVLTIQHLFIRIGAMVWEYTSPISGRRVTNLSLASYPSSFGINCPNNNHMYDKC